ncbi:MAG: Zn-dependent alcohol dehydrogenase [Acidimicrobiales bacterium]
MPRGAVCPGVGEKMEVWDLDLDAPKAGEVKVRMAAAGVCHSDLSIQNGTIMFGFPTVLGHEGAGVIEEVGEGVTDLEPGDHVVLSFVPQCGQCFFCSRGQGYLCELAAAGVMTGGLLDGTPRFSREGAPVRQMSCTGLFAEATVVPAIGAVKVPQDIPLKSAALIGCGVLTGVGAAINTAAISEGDTVAVIGCGGVGLNVIQGARIAGAGEIIAVDMVPTKLELATQFGATRTVNAAERDAVGGVMELTEQRGVDVAFEVIGLKQTIDQTIIMTRRGGQAIVVGVPRMDAIVEVPAFLGLVASAKTIKGCWYGSSNVHRDVPRLVELYQAGQLKLDELISRTITLDEVNDAFDAMERGEVARSVIEYAS